MLNEIVGLDDRILDDRILDDRILDDRILRKIDFCISCCY